MVNDSGLCLAGQRPFKDGELQTCQGMLPPYGGVGGLSGSRTHRIRRVPSPPSFLIFTNGGRRTWWRGS